MTLTLTKKAFTIAVAAATVLWLAGFASLVSPLTASAASAGDLIKGETLSTVYYLGSDGNRYTFPNEKTYFTWYTDFSSVETITDEELADIPLAGNVVYRPGSYWIKIQSSAKTYAVSNEGMIHWIETEDVAVGLAGDDWNQFIQDVPDVFFADYDEGVSLMVADAAYEGALVSGSVYLIEGGMKRLVTDDGMTANNYQERFVLDGTGIDLAGMTAGTDLTSAEYTDTAQLGDITGGLEVTLASDTASSVTIPAGAASVPFLSFNLCSTSGTATVTGIILKLSGVGGTANINNVYLYEGNSRLTNGRSVNASTREVTFSSVTVELNSCKTLTARVDVSNAPTGGDTAALQIASADKITSTASVAGTFPVTGNTMTFSATLAGEIEVTKSGTISGPTLGQNGATVGKFRLTADGEPADIYQVALTVDKASDHDNFELFQGGDKVSDCEYASGDLVTCELFDVYHLDDGQGKTFDLAMDVAGDAGDDVRVSVEEPTDVLAIGGDYGFNLAVDIGAGDPGSDGTVQGDYNETGANCAATGDDCSYSVIQGGQLTFAFNGPSTGDIAVDGNEQVLMNFAITSEQAVTINEFDMIIDVDGEGGGACDEDADVQGLWNGALGGTPNFDDTKIINSESGNTLMGPEELTGVLDCTSTINFDDQFDMTAGETRDLSYVIDVDNGAQADDEIHAELDTGSVDAEDLNGDALGATDIVPSTNLVGNPMTLVDATLEVTLTSPPGSGTWVKGTSNIDFAGFAFEAGEATDITVTDTAFLMITDDVVGGAFDGLPLAQDYISSCSIYDSESGAMIDGPESFDAADTIEFDNFNWDVAAGEVEKMLGRCNLANVNTMNGNDDAYALEINALGDVVAQDADGDDVVVTLTDGNGAETIFQTVSDAGTLDISLSGDTPDSTIILGSSTGISTSVFEADAASEAFTIKTLTLGNCIDPTVAGDVDVCGAGDTYGDDVVAANVKLSCADSGGATVTKTAYLSANQVKFTNLTCYVPTTEDATLSVTVDTNNVSATGADSGDMIRLNAIVDPAEFKAVGVGSGTTLTEADLGVALTTNSGGANNSVLADEMTARKTKPTISLASGSPSGNGIPGLAEVFRFNVSADSRGAVDFIETTFRLTSTNNGGAVTWNDCDGQLGDDAMWRLYNTASPSTEVGEDLDWTFYDSDEDGTCDAAQDIVWATLALDSAAGAVDDTKTVSAGGTKTYALKLDTTGASSADDDSLRIDIASQDDTDVGTDGNGDAFGWSDKEAGYIDGDLLNNLPVNGGTIVY